jgi:hypothetical protein
MVGFDCFFFFLKKKIFCLAQVGQNVKVKAALLDRRRGAPNRAVGGSPFRNSNIIFLKVSQVLKNDARLAIEHYAIYLMISFVPLTIV